MISYTLNILTIILLCWYVRSRLGWVSRVRWDIIIVGGWYTLACGLSSWSSRWLVVDQILYPLLLKYGRQFIVVEEV